MRGWIKLHRQFTQWEWYTDDKCFRLFIHLLLRCNHEDAKWQGETIHRGEVVTSLGHLANEVGMTMQTLRTTLKKLEKTGEINKQSTSKLTRITVCNYDTYQDQQQTTNTQTNKPLTNDQQATNKQLTTNKNDNNKENDNNDKETPVGAGDCKQELFLEPVDKVENTCLTFDEFWELYDKKVGRKACEPKWKKVKEEDRAIIKVKVPLYKRAEPNKKYRSNPETYINGELWHNEIISNTRETPQELARQREYQEPKRDLSKVMLN